MTRVEEKLYFQSVFDAIDQVYQMKKPQTISSYEERLRTSFNKLIIPDWYNHQYTSINGLRKTKSHGHVPRGKRTNQTHHHTDDDTPDTSISSATDSPHLSNGTHRQSHRHRSPSRSWSERPPMRRNSTTSSYDTNGSVINGRRSNGSTSYAPGVQRVAQSSTWYKPRIFSSKQINGNTNGHSIEPPKPFPRYSKVDQEHIYAVDPSLLKFKDVRRPVKPRTMAQAQIPLEESIDHDVTLVPTSPELSTTKVSLPFDNLPRTNSVKSVSSDAESYRSAVLPSGDKNLLATDSSSYASVNERCSSPSTASYHTARAGDTSSSSSLTGYETPTPQLDDDDNGTLSSHSSLSDLSHAETLEPNTEDLDSVAVSTAEHKSHIRMENSSLLKTNIDQNENTHWYEGSLETTIPQVTSELREIPNDEILREVDINAVGDEFFLFSPRNSSDDEPSNKEILESPTQTVKRIFTMDDKTLHDPFDFDNHTSSIMITNLDDILMDDDDDDDEQNYSPNPFLNSNYRRPIQEDILYEVEHENSFSDHSQNTSSITAMDDKSSIKFETNTDYMASAENPVINDIPPVVITTTTDNNILPIYILPPLFTTSPSTAPPPPSSSTSLHIDTNNNFQKWDSFIQGYPDMTSPSSYTSKIRHRHYSVGSYYDHKTTTVALHPPHTFHFLGSAPVSPLNRTTTNTMESHYHSPISYDHVSFNALRRVHPFLESHTYSNTDSRRTTDYRASSLTREEKSRVITYTSPKLTSKSVERTIPIIRTEPTPVVHQPIVPLPSTRTSSVTFPQYEVPIIRPKSTDEILTSTPRPLIEQTSSFIHPKNPPFEPELPPPIHPKSSRPRARTPPRKTIEKELTQNIYQEIDLPSTNDDQFHSPNADLQFIRGAIERVFHFHGESTTDTTSESSTFYEEVDEKHRKQPTKTSTQYPAVEAVQRFYNSKTLSHYNQRTPTDPITNLDDVVITHSSIKSPPITARKKSSQERGSSDEVDDTLNDIEDVDSPDEKNKRQLIQTSNENSSSHSLGLQSQIRKSSQETQTIERKKPSMQVTRTTVPPIDIVTEMVIEEEEDDNDGNHPQGPIDHVDGEMVIFYDDIEIVEHVASSCSSDSESTTSSSHHYSKPKNTTMIQPIPPPVPARTLKPVHLVTTNHRQSPSTTNKTYELEKSFIRKKLDVNSVNDMLNRTGPDTSHRHPSARHFAGKLNSDDSPSQPVRTNGQHYPPMKTSTLPIRSSADQQRSIIADTNALVKQIQNSLSRNSLHDTQINSTNLSTSNKDLRAFVSSTYSPSDENTIDDNGRVHKRTSSKPADEQIFKRQARLSKSFHNVSEYHPTDQYPKKEHPTQPSKSVEDNLNQVASHPTRPSHIPLHLTSVVTSTSFSALPNADDHARMLSMKWYTGQVSENSEICYNAHQAPPDDLLAGYISTHSNRETQALLARLQGSNDARIHAALDDIRSRVAQFDASKSQEDLHVFMRYLESRLRDLNNKTLSTIFVPNGQQTDHLSGKNRTNSIPVEVKNKEVPSSRQLGRQQLRSSGNNGEGTNGHQPIPPRRASQSSANQENPPAFDDMLNTVLGLPKKGVSNLPQTFPVKREKSTPLIPTQITTNTTAERDIGKRLFESGTYKDPRLIYDGPKKKEKEEEPLETSV